MKITEVIIDNRYGLGQTPNNEEVDYLGLCVKMKPSIFSELTGGVSREEVIGSELYDRIKNGEAIGAPQLSIKIPDDWKQNNFEKYAFIHFEKENHKSFSSVDEFFVNNYFLIEW